MTMRTHGIAICLALGSTACGAKHYIAKGDAHLEADRPDAAAQEYQRALDKDPTATPALRGMAASYVSRNLPIRAIIPAQRASKSGDVSAHRVLARALLTTGRSADALKTIKSARENLPEDNGFRLLLVEALIADGQLDNAADTADELLIDVSTPEARALHAWALSRADRNDAAVAMATEAIAIASDDGMIQAECASIFRKAKKKDPFMTANKMARALLPASPRQVMKRAVWFGEQGHKERAIRELEALRGAYSTSGSVAATLGLLYIEQESWSNAARHLDASLGLEPYALQRQVAGVSAMKSGDTLQEATRRKETITIATRLGEAHQAMGQHALAAQAWQTAVNRSSNPTVDQLIQIAKAWAKSGNVDQMGQTAQAATAIAPGNAEAHMLLARAYSAANNDEWAVRHAQKSWAIDQSLAASALFLGGLYEARGENRVAREIYRDALRRHPSDATLYAAFDRVGGSRRR